jgi:hypothetical protein
MDARLDRRVEIMDEFDEIERFRTKCRRHRNCRSDRARCFRSSISSLTEHGELANYYLTYSARADMYRHSAGQLRLGPLMRKLWR